MQHLRNFRRLLLVALFVGLGHMISCAGPTLGPDEAAEIFLKGEQSYKSGNHAAALELLQELRDSRAELDDDVSERLEVMIAECEAKVATARTDQAASLLADAGKLTEQGKYGDAAAKLDALAEYQDVLTAEQEAEADTLRGAKADRASALIAEGMAAYDEKDYVVARDKLKAAQDLDAELGFWDRRSLGKLEKIEATLDRLRAAYEDGKAAYAKGDYETAQALLVEVSESAVNIGQGVAADVAAKLADITGKLAQARAGEADRLLSEAAQLAAPAAEMRGLQAEVITGWRKAITAWNAGDYGAARPLLADVSRLLAQPLAGKIEALRDVKSDVDHMAAVIDRKIQIAAKLTGAVGKADEDLAGAESLVYEARALAEQDEWLAFTGAQEDTFNRIIDLAEGRFGARRALQRQQYKRLRALVQRYEDLGQLTEAEQMIGLLITARPGLVNRGDLRWAEGEGTKLSAAKALQSGNVEELGKRIEAARGVLAAGDPREAIAIALGALEEASQKLAKAEVARVGKKLLQFLETDVGAALKSAAEDINKTVDDGLAAARKSIAALQKAQELRGAPTTEEARQVYDLATKFAELAAAGKLAEATDAHVRLAAAQARLALQRADFAEAQRLLREAPTAQASSRVVKRRYEPVAEEAAALAAVDGALKAAEEALAAHELDKAAIELARAGGQRVESAFLQGKMQALDGVMAPVREALAARKGLDSARASATAAARAAVDGARARQAAWRKYYEAVKVFLTEDTERGRQALTAAAGEANLYAFERHNATAVVGEAARPAIEQVSDMLDRAGEAVKRHDYVSAGAWLARAAESPCMALDEANVSKAARLADIVAAAEARAEELYAMVCQAMSADDRGRVAELYGELRGRYKSTEAYRRRLLDR